MKEFNYDLESIRHVANDLILSFSRKVVLFYGSMGSGKTTLIKALVESLGGTDDVSSPTFSIVNEYEIDSGVLYHFDLYRIEDYSELLDIGFEDYLYSDQWVFIEWPERLKDQLPEYFNSIEIKINHIKSRTLKLTTDNEVLT